MPTQPLATLKLCDAHNHLQDERLSGVADEMWVTLEREGIGQMVVNGSSEEDWAAVLSLAQQHRQVIPSFGYHPWYVQRRSAQWQHTLLQFLDRVPSGIGEIGLDRWVKDHDMAQQEEVFRWQLGVAAERKLPVSIHCLQAWGRLFELLRASPRPGCGFVLHSFAGPLEMVGPLADLGAYFSFPGYFAHERKLRQRETFRHVPSDRLLIETDAPDQPLPPERVLYPLEQDTAGKPLNHPANLRAVYEFVATLLDVPLETLAARVHENFHRLFGALNERLANSRTP